ncbi:MAG: glycosyltransferase family 4 protein [Chloroflexi bacterium]|nr:glycosyltransferase family 4 protein [Chloroflexota bacterium]
MNAGRFDVYMLLDRYLPVIGGTELQASRLAGALQSLGHRLHVVTRRLTADLPAEEMLDGIQVRRLSPIGLSHVANGVMVMRIFLYLVAQRRRYHLVHVHGVGPLGLAALLSTKITGKPVLIKVAAYGNLSRVDHAGVVPNRYTRFVRRIILPPALWNWWLRQASAIVVLGRETLDEAVALGLGDRTVHIPNGVDTSRFYPLPLTERMALRRRLGIADEERILLFTGRLVRGKDPIQSWRPCPD